jgi:drug/metabolite transporter (DMT)-like permease
MSLALQPNLALLLFAPWFLILAVLYWLYPRQPRDAPRRLFDGAALAIALIAFIGALHWAHGYADRRYGEMWPQVLATSVGYGVFLAVLVVAVWARRTWLRRRVGRNPSR